MTQANIHPILARLEWVGDMFPCQVTLPNGRVLARARVLVYRTHIFVLWHDRMKIDPELAGLYRLAAEPTLPRNHLPRRHQQAHLETTDGTVHVQMLPGCNCGSPLRSMSPVDAAVAATEQGWTL